MADPPQQSTTSRPAWVRLCQGLWRGLWFFWTAIILTLVLGIVTTWFTTKSFDIRGTPLEWIPDHWPLVLSSGSLLLVLTVVVGYLGRPVTASPAQGHPTPQDQRELIRRLSHEYRRQVQSLSVVDNLDISPTRLTARPTLLIFA